MNSTNLSPQAAMQKLVEGNGRFVAGLRSLESLTAAKRRELAANGQTPFATVLSCSDSRVPSELVFDCGLGELFIVRVAGNVVAPSLLASMEFAAMNFGTSLIVVMGHSSCGAVAATVDAVRAGDKMPSDNLQNLVSEIRPSAIKAISCCEKHAERDKLVAEATRFNVEHSMRAILERSAVLSSLQEQGKLMITGAVYDLASGVVTFEEVPGRTEVSHSRGTSNALAQLPTPALL